MMPRNATVAISVEVVTLLAETLESLAASSPYPLDRLMASNALRMLRADVPDTPKARTAGAIRAPEEYSEGEYSTR